MNLITNNFVALKMHKKKIQKYCFMSYVEQYDYIIHKL